jgi:cobalt/nickel transport system permease protein
MKHAYIDEHSGIDSFIHRLDPRIKIITFVGFVFFIIFTQPTSWLTFLLYGLILVSLIALSKIPVRHILKKSLVVVPFVLVVAVFIPFMKHGAGGYSFGPVGLHISQGGLMVFWNVLIKSYLSVLCMIMLTASTRFSDLLKGFEKLKCPQLIIMVLSFMYRYIFVIEDEFMKMKQAKASRSVGDSKWVNMKALANMVGVLFVRAYERAESVYLAMSSRGFDGTIRTIHHFQIKTADIIFLSAMLVSLIGVHLIGI